MMTAITKKAIVQAATEVAERAPRARNRSSKMVDRRQPRGLIGRTLHAVGLSPAEIRAVQGGSRKFSQEERLRNHLNPSATAWVMEANARANQGMTWAEVVSTTR